jgi:hypothetical protein
MERWRVALWRWRARASTITSTSTSTITHKRMLKRNYTQEQALCEELLSVSQTWWFQERALRTNKSVHSGRESARHPRTCL